MAWDAIKEDFHPPVDTAIDFIKSLVHGSPRLRLTFQQLLDKPTHGHHDMASVVDSVSNRRCWYTSMSNDSDDGQCGSLSSKHLLPAHATVSVAKKDSRPHGKPCRTSATLVAVTSPSGKVSAIRPLRLIISLQITRQLWALRKPCACNVALAIDQTVCERNTTIASVKYCTLSAVVASAGAC